MSISLPKDAKVIQVRYYSLKSVCTCIYISRRHFVIPFLVVSNNQRSNREDWYDSTGPFKRHEQSLSEQHCR